MDSPFIQYLPVYFITVPGQFICPIKKDFRQTGSLYIFMPYTRLRTSVPSVTTAASSSQEILRHTEVLTYRCFLPNLTGFMSSRCGGPGSQRHLLQADLRAIILQRGFDLAIADCELQGTATSPSSTAKIKMAERGGFEPPNGVSRYTISNRAP